MYTHPRNSFLPLPLFTLKLRPKSVFWMTTGGIHAIHLEFHPTPIPAHQEVYYDSAKSLYSDDKPVHYNMYISKEGRHVRHDGADLSAKGHELLLSTVVNLPTPCLWLLSFTFTKHFHPMQCIVILNYTWRMRRHIVKCLTTLYFLIIFSSSSSHVLTAVKALSCLFYKTSQVLALQKNLKVQSA